MSSRRSSPSKKREWLETTAKVEAISDTTTKGWVWLRIEEVHKHRLFTLHRTTVGKDVKKGDLLRVLVKPHRANYTDVHYTIPLKVIGDHVRGTDD